MIPPHRSMRTTSAEYMMTETVSRLFDASNLESTRRKMTTADATAKKELPIDLRSSLLSLLLSLITVELFVGV